MVLNHMSNRDISDDDKTTYYYINNKRYNLFKDPSIHAVKFKSAGLPESRNLSDKSIRFLREESERIAVIPNYELHVYQTDPHRLVSRSAASGTHEEDAARDLKFLEQDQEVDYVSPAYRQTSKSLDVMFATKRFSVKFKPEVTNEQMDELNSKYGVKIIKKIGYTENAYLLEAPAADGDKGAVALSNVYFESGKAVWSNPDLIKQRHLRKTSTESVSVARSSSYAGRQWHLKTAKVIQAWRTTKGSPDVSICIMDDGVEALHHEFDGKIVKQYDFSQYIADGNPKNYQDRHGTSCAGVAAAAGVKAYGAAPKCSLISICTPVNLGIQDEAEMFVWAADNGADIISCSWGPRDGVDEIVPLPDTTKEAIRYCVTQGRDRKGIPIFWAAGNGNVANPGESVDDDGYASNPDVMAIAASTNPDANNRETKAPYSDIGKALFVSAPSSGGSKSILTVDRRGSAGYNPEFGVVDEAGEYTDSFGGTSSSTPLVAGIAALMLSVNSDLTLDQVRDIIRRTADKIGNGSTYHPDQSTGLPHSELYGYGRINATKAVKEAQNLSIGRSATRETTKLIAETAAAIPTLVSLNHQDESLWRRAMKKQETNRNKLRVKKGRGKKVLKRRI
jgi:subtilisin family serine protease